MEQNYKPNSNKYKEAQKEAAAEQQRVAPQKVISGTATIKPKSTGKKLAENIISGDAKKAKEYVVEDILIPSLKKLISEGFKSIVDILLYGEPGRSRRDSLPANKTSYTKYYEKRDRDDYDRRERVMTKSIFDYDTFEFVSMGDAETVLTAMDDLIAKYGMVRVADYYDLIGESTNNHCANNYGWTDLRSAKIVRTRDGYIIDFPKAMPID